MTSEIVSFLKKLKIDAGPDVIDSSFLKKYVEERIISQNEADEILQETALGK